MTASVVYVHNIKYLNTVHTSVDKNVYVQQVGFRGPICEHYLFWSNFYNAIMIKTYPWRDVAFITASETPSLALQYRHEIIRHEWKMLNSYTQIREYRVVQNLYSRLSFTGRARTIDSFDVTMPLTREIRFKWMNYKWQISPVVYLLLITVSIKWPSLLFGLEFSYLIR